TSNGQNSSRDVPVSALSPATSVPREEMRAPSPGRMFDSSAENISTANRSGASSVATPDPAPGDALGSAVGVAPGVAPGDPDGLGAGITSARYTPSCRVLAKVTDDAPVAPGPGAWAVPLGRV